MFNLKIRIPVIILLVSLSLCGCFNLHRIRSSGGSRIKGCAANMRVLLGAIEMYNMDFTDKITRLNSYTIDQLIKGNYLRGRMPQCPEGGTYLATDQSEESSIFEAEKPQKPLSDKEALAVPDICIRCTIHGTLDDIIQKLDQQKREEEEQAEKLKENLSLILGCVLVTTVIFILLSRSEKKCD